MRLQKLPDPILTAAADLLNPYAPDLTPGKLVQALQDFAEETGPAAPDKPLLLRKRTVARLLEVSEATVNRRLRDGVLPRVEIGGGSVRIPAAAVYQLAAHGSTDDPESHGEADDRGGQDDDA